MGEENGRDEKADAAASYCMLAALDAEGHWMTTTSTPAACKLLHTACSYVQRVMHARTHARTQLLFGSLWLVSHGQRSRARMLVPPISSFEGALGSARTVRFSLFHSHARSCLVAYLQLLPEHAH